MARKKLLVDQKYSFCIPWLHTRVLRYQVFDIETTGVNPRTSEIFSFCIGYWNGDVDVYRVDYKSKKRNARNWKILERFFADTSIAKIAHNYKFELSFLKKHGIHVPEGTVWHDTILMSQLLRNLAPRHALEWLGWELFDYPRDRDIEVKKLGTLYGGYHKVPKDLMHDYQIDDGLRPMVLFRIWKKYFRPGEPLWEDYVNEIELVKTTQRLESYGIMIHRKNAEELLVETRINFRRVQEETYNYLGEYINLNSDKKLVPLLYERFGFPVLKLTKNKNPSVDKDVLFELKELFPDEKIFDLIFRWRTYRNGMTIIKSYLDLCDDKNILYPNINTNKARTGRESSENPNLQNVQKSGTHQNQFALPSRRCFRARPRHKLYFVDYAGIEMRLIIALAGEEELLNLISQGGDPHKLAAELFFGELFTSRTKCISRYLPLQRDLYKAFKKEMRRNPYKRKEIVGKYFQKCQKLLRGAAKNGQFALAYGAGLNKIAKTLRLDEELLRPGYERYCLRFPRIAAFTHDMALQGRECGYVETPFGRKLYASRDKLYSLSNYRVQGTAAGILKRAQVRVDDYLKKCWNDRVRIVLPIHDEIVLEIPDSLAKYADMILHDVVAIMVNMKEINVILEAECKSTSASWDDAEDYEYKLAA